MQIGDRVRITGPDWNGDTGKFGEVFLVDMQSATLGFSAPNFPWYRETSLELASKPKLELVEELAIGDEVEVIGPADYGAADQIGRKFKIEEQLINNRFRGYFSRNDSTYIFPASSLRKIPEPEKETIGYKKQEYAQEIEKATNAIRNILAPLVDERLSDIEKQLAGQEKSIDFLADRLSVYIRAGGKIRKRLHDLEAWHKAKDQKADLTFSLDLDTSGFCRELEKAAALARKLAEPEPALQIGDWVRVMGSQPHIFRISSKHDYLYSGEGESGWHMAGNLRKLSDEEISQRLNERPA